MARKNSGSPSAGSPARTRRAEFVASEKGGVWKTAYVTRLVPYWEAAGLRVGIVQVDEQPKLEILFPGRVITIIMPGADALRRNGSADAVALSPLYDALLDPSWDVVIVDIGANLDKRVCAFMTSTALHEVLASERIAVLGLVPMHPDDDAVLLGCETLDRLSLALPDVRRVPVLCADDGGAFQALGENAQKRFDAAVRPFVDAGETLHFPRLPREAVSALARSNLTANAFADLDHHALVRTTELHPAVARQLQGDLIKHVAEVWEDLDRMFGTFRGADGPDYPVAT